MTKNDVTDAIRCHVSPHYGFFNDQCTELYRWRVFQCTTERADSRANGANYVYFATHV
jgi:hypothetical protein